MLKRLKTCSALRLDTEMTPYVILAARCLFHDFPLLYALSVEGWTSSAEFVDAMLKNSMQEKREEGDDDENSIKLTP